MAYLECISRYGNAGVVHNWDSAPTPNGLTDFTTGDFTMPGTLPDTPWALIPDNTVGTDMTVAAAADDVILTVTSTSGMSLNDKVIVELDSGEWFWSRIDQLLGNDVTLLYGIPSAAAIGNRVAVASQLDGLTTFTLVTDFRAVKANDIIGKSGQLSNSFISNTDHNEFQLTNHNLADVAGFFTSAKDPTKYTLETFDGLGYTFTDYEDLNELADLLSEAHSEIITGQSSLITLVTRAVNSQAGMDAIVDSRTEPLPSGGGTYLPFAHLSDLLPTVRTSTATENVSLTDDYIRIDATAATRVLTLPDATTVSQGKDYKFKLVAKGTGFYGEIALFAGDSIDGSTSARRLATVGDVFTLRRVGDTAWDIVQSARTAHAEMYMTGGEITGQTNVTTTPEAVEAWTDNGADAQGIVTADQANYKFTIDHIEDTVNGDHYKISANLSYEFASSSLLELSVHVGGVATGLRTITKGLGFSNDQLNTTVSGDFTTTSTGDVEIMIASVTGTNDVSWWTGHVDLVRH